MAEKNQENLKPTVTGGQPVTPGNQIFHSDSLINALTAGASSVIFIIQDDRFCYVNAAAETICGYNREDLSSMSLADMVHPDDMAGVEQRMAYVRSGGVVKTAIEIRLLTRDRTMEWLDLSIDAIDLDGRPALLCTGFNITARKRVEQDLVRRTEELSILHSLSVDINASHDYSGLLPRIVERAVTLLRADSGGLYTCDAELKTVTLAISYNVPGVNTGITLKYGEGAAGVVAETGQPIIIEDYRTWSKRAAIFEHDQPFVGVIAVPMLWQGRVMGVIDVLERTERCFNKWDMELLSLFAAQATVALENARSLSVERRRRQEAETLTKVTSVVTSSLNLEQVLGLILTHLEEVVPFHSASVFLQHGPNLKIVACKGFWQNTAIIGKEFPANDALFVKLREIKKPLIIENAQLDARFNRWLDTGYVGGWMGVPLIVRDDVIGYVTLDHRKVGAYHRESARLAEAFVNQAASAIENARLFEAERTQLLLAQTLQAVGALLSSQLGLEEVLERILDLLGRVVGYDTVSIQLVGQNGHLQLAAGRGFSDPLKARKMVEDLSEYILRTRWQNLQVIVIPDVLGDARWVPHPDAANVRSWIGAPLLVKGHFIGSLNVDHRTPNAYDMATGETVMAFANQAAVAIENTRLFEAERMARERAEALRDAARIIGSSLALQDVLQAVLDQLLRVLQYDSGNIMLVEDDELMIKAWRGYDTFIDARLIDPVRFKLDADFTVADVVHYCRPITLANVQENPIWKVLPISQHIHSWLGLPIIIREQCIGVVNLDRATRSGFSEEEIALAQSFAVHVSTAIENASLYEAEGQRAAELEAVRQASLSLTASLDLPDVLNLILTHVLIILPGAHDTHIYLYYPEADRLAFGAALWAGGRRGSPLSMPRPNGITHTVARTGETMVVPDMALHPIFKTEAPERSGAVVGLPLKIGERVVGVMNLSYQQPRAFHQNELRVLRLLGDQAAVAIENARLYEQAEAEQRHLSLLYEVSRDLVSSLNPREILNSTISLTCQALGGLVAQAHLYAAEEDRLKVVAIYGRANSSVDEINNQVRLNLGDGLIGWVAKYARAEIVSDVLQDHRWRFVSGIDDDVRSAICAPLMVGENMMGVLSIFHSQPAAFTLEHLKLLQAICQEVGLALSNAARYEEVQRRLNEITLIQNLTQTFNQRLELQDLLDVVVAQLEERLGYPQVEIFLMDGEYLVQRAASGSLPGEARIPLTCGVVGRVARTGEPALVLDVGRDPDYDPNTKGTVAELAVPIFLNKFVVGVINIETHLAGRLTTQDRDLLQVLAGQISIALENSVLYDRSRRHAEDLERIVIQRTAELVQLYELSQKIGYTLSYNDLLNLLLGHLRKAVNSDLVVGALFIGSERFVSVEADCPLSEKVVDSLQLLWLEAAQNYGLLVGDGEKLSIEVNASDSYQAHVPPMDEVASIIQAPVLVDGVICGVLIAGCKTENAFSRDQSRILDTFANQAAVALQRLAALLAAEQKRLEGLVEHLPVGVLLLDGECRLLLANPLGKELLALVTRADSGEPMQQFGGLPVKDLMARHTDFLPLDIELDTTPRRHLEAQARPIGKGADRWVITLREVTQERETRDKIYMQERLATVGQLAAGIAHDFNNIMAAILVYAELLIDDPALPPVSRERLGIIQQQVERAASLIRQILDFSRRSVMEQSPIDLLPFIKELDKMLRRVMPETITLELTYAPGEYVVNADPTRLQQALMNLALNARDAMPGGGVLCFGLHHVAPGSAEMLSFTDLPVREWICLTVQDTGMGVAAEHLPHMFEPFFTTKPVGQGTGLGLAQVYGIIKQHDGYIDLHSDLGKGTLFSIYLPAHNPPSHDDKPIMAQVDFDGAGLTALVVEDDATTRDALEALLVVHNYRVLVASNGIEAIQSMEAENGLVDILVSDLVMPQMGGLALYRVVQERWPGMRTLFITGHPLQEESQALLEMGSVHWLQKPFSVQEFREAIFYLIQRKPGGV